MFFSLFMDSDFRLLKSMHAVKIAANEATKESHCLFKWNFVFLYFVALLFLSPFFSTFFYFLNYSLAFSFQIDFYPWIDSAPNAHHSSFWRLPFQYTFTNINSFELHRNVLFHCILYSVYCIDALWWTRTSSIFLHLNFFSSSNSFWI